VTTSDGRDARDGRDRWAVLANQAKPAVRDLWRRALRLRATDITARSAARSCLVVAPHPDDETLGCGATIARKVAAGTDVTIVIVADGRNSHSPSRRIDATELASIRAAEAEAACAELGVAADRLVQWGLEDTHVAERIDPLAERLDRLIREVRPDEVLVASRYDWHPDHQAVAEALQRAPAARDVAVLEYPVWFWADGPWVPRGERPVPTRAAHLVLDPIVQLARLRPRVVATGSHLETKVRALAAYRSQVTNYTGEPDWPVMGDRLLANFLGPHEFFFEVDPGPRRSRT
jgi:LmbE family N-acetylglucosaminyl deacetylase